METVIFKIDKKLKKAVQKRAKSEGVSITDVFKTAARSYADGEASVKFVQPSRFNAKTVREMRQIIKDIKAGKNLSPAFKTIEEMREYLEN